MPEKIPLCIGTKFILYIHQFGEPTGCSHVVSVVKKEPMKIGEHVCLYWAKEFFGFMLMCCTVESHGRYLSGF